jgi:hypothetical protein
MLGVAALSACPGSGGKDRGGGTQGREQALRPMSGKGVGLHIRAGGRHPRAHTWGWGDDDDEQRDEEHRDDGGEDGEEDKEEDEGGEAASAETAHDTGSAQDSSSGNGVEQLWQLLGSLRVQPRALDLQAAHAGAGGAAQAAPEPEPAAEAEAEAGEEPAGGGGGAAGAAGAAAPYLAGRGGVEAATGRALVVSVGVVGEPNLGKSSLINAIFGAKVVSRSATPGHTKHLQSLYFNRSAALIDSPGVIFARAGVPAGLQVLLGSVPISQLREPYSALRYWAERVQPRIHRAYAIDSARLMEEVGVEPSVAAQQDATMEQRAAAAAGGPTRCYEPEQEGGWSPFALAEAWAYKKQYRSKGGRPDVPRAANQLLREAMAGMKLPMWFVPPTPAGRAAGAAQLRAERLLLLRGGGDADGDGTPPGTTLAGQQRQQKAKAAADASHDRHAVAHQAEQERHRRRGSKKTTVAATAPDEAGSDEAEERVATEDDDDGSGDGDDAGYTRPDDAAAGATVRSSAFDCLMGSSSSSSSSDEEEDEEMT